MFHVKHSARNRAWFALLGVDALQAFSRPCAGASFGGSGVVRSPAHGPRVSAATAVCGRAACLTARSLGFLCCLCGVPVLAVEAREADVAHAAHEIVGDPLGHVVRHEAALLRDAA